MTKPPGKTPSRDIRTVVRSGNPEYLRHARQQARLSLRDLSDEAGVSPTYLMYLEKGTKPLSLERLETFESAIKRLRAARSEK
jgi:transcriptional regulator with XRE-family HTH domain